MIPFDLTLDCYRAGDVVATCRCRMLPLPAEWAVSAVSDFTAGRSRSTLCYRLQPDGYRMVELHSTRQGRSSHLHIDAGEDRIGLSRDGILCSVPRPAGPLLFDGPGPLFDYHNAVLLLGLCDGETMERIVHRIDVNSGTLVSRHCTFRRRGERYTIWKGLDGLRDVTIDGQANGSLRIDESGYLWEMMAQ